MRHLVLLCLAAVVIPGCNADAESPSDLPTVVGESTLAIMARTVPVVSATPIQDLLAQGESPRAARERRIERILELYPELARYETFMAAIRGEYGPSNIMLLDARYGEAAPLIAEIQELNWLEKQANANQTTEGR